MSLLCSLQNITEVHYLDVGLNCRGAHLTDPQVLHALSSFANSLPQAMAIWLHGTARQWGEQAVLLCCSQLNIYDWYLLNQYTYMVCSEFACHDVWWLCIAEDKSRPFVKQEKDRFREILQHAGLPTHERCYFAGQHPSLLMHFQVIEAMKRG